MSVLENHHSFRKTTLLFSDTPSFDSENKYTNFLFSFIFFLCWLEADSTKWGWNVFVCVTVYGFKEDTNKCQESKTSKRSRCSRWSGDEPDEDLSPGPSMWTGQNRGKREAMCLTWTWSRCGGEVTELLLEETQSLFSCKLWLMWACFILCQFVSLVCSWERLFTSETNTDNMRGTKLHKSTMKSRFFSSPVLITHTAACWHLLDTPIMTESRL